MIREAEAALAALDLSAPRDIVAADLERLAGWQREAIEISRAVEAQAASLGHPGALSDLVDTVRHEAIRIAEGFARVSVAFDRVRRAVLANAWPSEIVEVVRSHCELADSLFAQLAALVTRAEELTARSRSYFDRSFGLVHADPAWSEVVGTSFDEAGRPFGARLDDLPDYLDG